MYTITSPTGVSLSIREDVFRAMTASLEHLLSGGDYLTAAADRFPRETLLELQEVYGDLWLMAQKEPPVRLSSRGLT